MLRTTVIPALALLPFIAHAQFVARVPKFSATSVETAAARQGSSVAISSDGNTLVEGGPLEANGRGAMWVLVRSGNSWSQEAKLQAADASGERVFQGRSVALSADGNTALVGGEGDGQGAGAAWIFTRENAIWTQQAKLLGVGAAGAPGQGRSVALSADGNTAMIGGPGDDGGAGAAWVFTRSNGIWAQQGTKLAGSGADGAAGQGRAVALSADGNTALIGGSDDAHQQGAVWVFVRSNGAWVQQGSKLVGSGASGHTVYQGFSVGLSNDGNVAVIGGYGDSDDAGAAWTFTRSAEDWTQSGDKTAGNAPGAQAGYSVAMAGDGTRLLLGSPGDAKGAGATLEFVRANGVWAPVGRILGGEASGEARRGESVAMATGGRIAIIGGAGDNHNRGALWTFGDPILAISPPASAIAGAPAAFSITALDGLGNSVPNYLGTVHFSSSDAQAGLPANAKLSDGMGEFSATFKTTGTQTISATDTAVASINANSGAISVSLGTPVRLAIGIPPRAVTGEQLIASISAVDAFNNDAPYTGAVRMTSSDAHAQLAKSRATVESGQIPVKFWTPGKQTLTVSAVGNQLAGTTAVTLDSSATTDYASAVLATQPLAYFRLEATNDTSQVNGYTSTFQGSAALTSNGAPVCELGNSAALLNGTTGWVNTSLVWPGAPSSGSVALWVNLAELPSQSPDQIFFLGGFGIRYLAFLFTASSESNAIIQFYESPNQAFAFYLPTASTLIGQWHMIAGVFDANAESLALYWDGQQVQLLNKAGIVAEPPPAAQPFTIGAISSTLCVNCQNLDGTIDEVAVWNNTLTSAQIATLYSSASCPPPATITDNEVIHVTDTETVPVIVTTNVNPPNAGTVTGGGPYNAGTTATLTATANTGYTFANFSGDVPTTSANPLQVTATAAMNITANFTPLAPALAATAGGNRTPGGLPGTLNVPLTITNVGHGVAVNAQIVSVTATTLGGTGSVTLASGVPSAPVMLAPGTSTTINVTFNWPSTVTRASLKLGMNATNASGTNYLATQTITIFQ